MTPPPPDGWFMLAYGLTVAVLLLAVGYCEMWARQRALRADLRRVMEVLQTASPELARRVIEQGTAVKVNYVSAWGDEDLDRP